MDAITPMLLSQYKNPTVQQWELRKNLITMVTPNPLYTSFGKNEQELRSALNKVAAELRKPGNLFLLINKLNDFNATDLISVLTELEPEELERFIDLPTEHMKEILIRKKKQIDFVTFKLSRLQKEILVKALEKTPQKDGSIRWEPAEWFSDGNPQSDKERASLSRCLARLQKRGLIIRQRISCSDSTRTHSIKLTELGRRAGRRLQNQNKRLTS